MSGNGYGVLDRALHRVAFATTDLQLTLAGLERRLYRRELANVALDRPVLITALPRAGTTILLELLAATATFAASTYRDVPFVACPLLLFLGEGHEEHHAGDYDPDAKLREGSETEVVEG